MRKIVVGFALAAFMLQAQETFEVASIKPSTAKSVRGWNGGPGSKDPTRYTFEVASLLDLIGTAYNMHRFQVISKATLEEPRFDVDARIPAGATKEQFRLMLQNLLAERFHLKGHTETRDFRAFELTVASSGERLDKGQPELDPKRFPTLPEGRPAMTSNLSNGGDGVMVHLAARQQTVAALAETLTVPESVPVVDHTGLTAKYDFLLEYTYAIHTATAEAPQPGAAPDIFQALEKQLGLKLTAKKLPFDVLVVDSIDKSPTAN